MSNSIKYSTGAETLALKRGNFYIGTGDVGKGPTSTTGYWNGITPPAGGYTIYLNKPSNGPSIYVAVNDSQLINYTNRIAGTSYSTANECLSYFAGQTDKMVFNKDYESIVTNGLVMVLDPSFTPSYPKGGDSINNLSTNPLTFTLTNGVGFSSDGGGSLVFDGVDDVVISDVVYTMTNDMTWSVWVKKTSLGNQYNMIFSNIIPYMAFRGEGAGSNTNKFHFSFFTVTNGVNTQRSIYSTLAYNINTWYNVTFTLSFDIPNQIATGKIYVNGLYDTQLTVPTSSLYQVNSTNRLRLGSYPSSQYPFPGNIGLFTIYNRILSEDEISQNYNAMAYLGSRFNPANSASAILSDNPSAPDGYYWINTTLGPRQLYCIMSLGGWMGITSEISPQIANLSTSASWESNTSGRLQSANPQILNVTVQEGNCGSPTYYSLRKPSDVGISYTQTMLLIERITTIGQCSYITNTTANGWYNGPVYSGSYTSNGMCLWGDGVFANACCGAQNMTNLKPYWVIFGGGGSNFDLTYQVQCAGGTGQHYHMWFVK